MRRFPTLIMAAAGLLLAAFPTGEAAAQSAPPIKLDFAGSPTWLGQAPVMVAIEKGYFKEQGLEVTFRTILSSADRVRAITSGDVAFSNLGRSSVISEMARGNRHSQGRGDDEDGDHQDPHEPARPIWRIGCA